MANTGKLIVTTLRKWNVTTNTATGDTKPNVPGDPDYIPPTTDLTECPLPVTPVCPVVSILAGPTNIAFNFSLAPADFIRSLYSVNVVLKKFGVEEDNIEIMYPVGVNVFSGNFTGLTNGDTYTIDVQLKDGVDGVLHNCPSIATATLSGGGNCAMIVGLTVPVETSDGGTFEWTAVPGVTGYEYQVDGGAWISIGNVITFDLTGQTSGVTHLFKVRAVDGALKCPQEAAVSFTTLGTGIFTINNFSDNTVIEDVTPAFYAIAAVLPMAPGTSVTGTHAGTILAISVDISGDSIQTELWINGVLIEALINIGTATFTALPILATDNVEIRIHV